MQVPYFVLFSLKNAAMVIIFLYIPKLWQYFRIVSIINAKLV